MRSERVAVVGAGVAGLVSAVDLAARGLDVVVCERAAKPGGKMREVPVAGTRIDGGPTVLTMRWVFDALFDAAGASFDAAVPLEPVEVIARHAWSERDRLDLFSDVERSADAIGTLAGAAEARGYRRFSERARAVYETLEAPFIHGPRTSPLGLTRAVGLRRLPELWRIQPFETLWRALGRYFADPRLRQLFGRYATYVGSSPFRAPATLMLIAHVEREGVWLPAGGMYRVAESLAALAEKLGVRFRYGAEVAQIRIERGRAAGVTLAGGERIDADCVVSNADVAALAGGRFGAAAARAVPRARPAHRSLSAVTWNVAAATHGFPLARHTVFFSRDYPAEFEDIFRQRRLPREPTVYVCAQDRHADEHAPVGRERLLCLVNAPPTGDAHPFPPSEIEPCEKQTFDLLARCGLQVERSPETTVVTTPADFERLFPATGGALYGPASHGWQASFRRPGSRAKVPGLYLAGGSTHPGPGVPMAALAGRLAAATVLADLASTSRSRTTATRGGTSMPGATTNATD